MPSRNWKKKQYGRAWNKTDTVVTSIGQGFALASPLQLAVMISRIAAEGRNILPSLIKKDQNKVENDYLDVSREGINLIKGAMFNAVNSPGGTAFQSRVLN